MGCDSALTDSFMGFVCVSSEDLKELFHIQRRLFFLDLYLPFVIFTILENRIKLNLVANRHSTALLHALLLGLLPQLGT